jgi:hypothetical protein
MSPARETFEFSNETGVAKNTPHESSSTHVDTADEPPLPSKLLTHPVDYLMCRFVRKTIASFVRALLCSAFQATELRIFSMGLAVEQSRAAWLVYEETEDL